MSLDLRALLDRLVTARVEFVLVGGLAVNAWGHVRGTRDVDLAGTRIRVCSLRALLEMKRASTRLRDLDDLDVLETAHGDDTPS